MSYPDDPTLAFRNILIESCAGMAVAIGVAFVALFYFRLSPGGAAVPTAIVAVAVMNAAHDRLKGNRKDRT